MSTYCRISKEIEFDAGHRVPNHNSKCRNPHGHRYKVRVTCKGHIIEEEGASDQGMLIDFADLKMFMVDLIHETLDHGFIMWEEDHELYDWIGSSDWKIIEFPYIPTAENLARWSWEILEDPIRSHFRDNLVLEEVAVWETPTSVAYYNGGE